MTLYRYSHWDGSQSLPPFDADDVLEALSDDILAEGDVRRALQRLMQRGMRGTRGGDVPGLRRIVEQLRARRAEELSRANLDGMLDEVASRLEEIVEQERQGIERRVHDSEQRALDAAPGPAQDQARLAEQVLRRTAQQRRDRLDALPDDLAGRLSGLRDYEFMDADARDAFNALTDELRQQLLQTYFNATAGQRIFFDVQERTGAGNARWRLIDPAGNFVFNNILEPVPHPGASSDQRPQPEQGHRG